MSKAMASISDRNDNELNKIKEDFTESMKLAFDIFGNKAFRKVNRHTKRLPPINKALFDAISVQFGLLSKHGRDVLRNHKGDFKSGFKELLNKDEYFYTSVTSSTGDKNKVIHRHSSIEDLIKSIIDQ
jgi:hypothetical protein